jgi:Fe-S-cluster-containing hydrogenase component 2
LKKRLEITPHTCIGCRTCELACSFAHAKGPGNLGQTRIIVNKTGEDSFIPYTCFQCVDAACLKVCPVEALKRKPDTGAADLDLSVCIKCKACVIACPFGNIHIEGSRENIIKCDLCGGDPACAKFCPTKTLSYDKIK